MASIPASSEVVSIKVNSSDNNNEGKYLSEQALVEAATNGDYERVLELLSYGVSVDAEDYNKLLYYTSENYLTPLQKAAENGHVKCLQALIEHGADVNAKDRFGVSALHVAAEKGHYLCLRVLLEANADCSLPTKYSKAGCFKAVPHIGGTTPLHLAAAKNHVDCVKELIQYGADYNAVDERGRTSLYIAAQAGFQDCLLAHLKYAMGQDILSLPSFETSDTPLHFAVSHGMVDAVQELLYLGSDVNHINYMGCSPLHLAVSLDQHVLNAIEILKLLVLKGYNTNINLPDVTDSTPLHYVSFVGRTLWCRRPEMSKFLIAYGADINIKNNLGRTLLESELKSSKDDYEILKYIIRSILQPPRLITLNLSNHSEPYLPIDMPLNRPQNYDLGLQILGMHRGLLLPNIHGHHPYLAAEMYPFRAITRLLPHEVRPWYPLHLRPRHINFVMNHPDVLYDDFDANQYMNEGDLLENHNEDANVQGNALCTFKKRIWYEQIASNPRTLQHICRFTVRQSLGPNRLKYIEKLPIPSLLQSYLLLEYGE